MTTNTYKKRNVKVLNKDFNSLKQALTEHIKVYFPNDYQDFNTSSIGMMMVELGAYVGDVMNFYLDKKFEETFIQTAKEKKNIFKHAKHLGFKSFGKTAAFGKINCFIKVPNININGRNQPDMRYAGNVKKGTKLLGGNGQSYEMLENADFSTVNVFNTNLAKVAETNSASEPTSWALQIQDVGISAGETKTSTVNVAAYQPFFKTTIADENVIEVLSVVDSSGESWYEVDYLAQDTIFSSITNLQTDYNLVPYVLRLIYVPRRFITEYDVVTNKTSLIFGTGDADSSDDDLIPNLGDLSLPTYGKDTFTDYAIDPQNYLKTKTLGLAPTNTSLTISYRVGGGTITNSGANQITTVADIKFEVGDSTLDQSLVADTESSFSVTNPLPVLGGSEPIDTDQLSHLISANFAAQSRAVTAEDYIVRCLSMPSKFGAVFRASARSSTINNNVVEIAVISRDENGYLLTAPATLKSNLKTYLNKFRMMTDAVDILDSEIINVSFNFGILTKSEYNKNDVIISCISALKEYFDITKWQIGQSINRTELRTIIAELPGVVSVYSLNAYNKSGLVNGLQYSTSSYNLDVNTQNDIIYCKENSIFEVKYPNKDITISAK